METIALLVCVAACLLMGLGLNLIHNYLDRRLDLERDRLEAETAPVETEPALFTLQPTRGLWTPEDAARTRDFFRSPTGLRFAEQLRFSEGALLLRAIHASPEEQQHLCGQAAGYRVLLKDISDLFSPSAEHADTPSPASEQAGEG